MPSPIFMSRPPVGFSTIAVLRGAQLSFVGSIKAFLNNRFHTVKLMQLVLKAIASSLLIQFVIMLPIWLLKSVIWIFDRGFGANLEPLCQLIQSFNFIFLFVFDIGFILISSLRFINRDFDDLFLLSLQSNNSKYYESLQKTYYSVKDTEEFPKNFFTNNPQPLDSREYNASLVLYQIKENKQFKLFLIKNLKRSALTLSIFVFSYFPTVGPLVIPTVLLYSTNKVMGAPIAFTLFTIGLTLLDRNQSILILTSFWTSRSLINDLLSPFFLRVPFSKTDKTHWLRTREGILFGFGMAFYWIVKNLPMATWVLIYGVAQASVAFLVTKVSQPPPTVYGPQLFRWIENEVVWTKQDNFLYGNIL